MSKRNVEKLISLAKLFK